jgi:DNA helicase-2/ATP-dependent DNA helicase PcrA
MDAILEGLNNAQRSAVTTPADVVQVLAPPGSGKTKTLTSRVAYLIQHEHYRPWNIVVCTFTKKAANEMKERICGMIGNGIEKKLVMGTFHSVAQRYLVRYGQEIGLEKGFGIADTTDTKAILKRIITRGNYNIDPKHAGSRISKLKAKGTSANQFGATTKKAEEHEFACVYTEYEDTLRASNLLDFDDLLLRCTELLRKYPACVSNIEAVLIDEYQDTNNVQYELMRLLAQAANRITIVGDPDQSIYSFRSAEIGNLKRMQKDYPDTLVINLEENYRSSGCILNAAMAVIEQDKDRPNKSLLATHCVGEQPTLRHLAHAQREAQWIAEEIERSRTLTAGLLNHGDYAILLRSGHLSRSIENELLRMKIPHRMVGIQRFFDRAEIKIVLDYLRVISQPSHNDALARIINVPSRKIGDKTAKGLLAEAEERKVSLWSLLLDSAKGKRLDTKISAPAQRGIDTLVNLILTARKKLLPENGDDCNLFDIMTYVLQKIQFETYLKTTHKDDYTERWANIEELIAQATQMATDIANGEEAGDDSLPDIDGLEQRKDTAADILSKFLANVALSMVDNTNGEEANQVTISTIHSAKGLEWPAVFIPAVYDGSIPHSRNEDHDEERRLLYVAMTRAKALLYLSCPVWQSNDEQTTLSTFLSPPEVQRAMSLHGPSIGCSLITDIAKILRRPCPTNSAVTAGQALAQGILGRVEDNKDPTKREYIDGSDEPSHNYADGDSQQRYKRRKIESARVVGGFTTATTMQRASSFSVATTTLPSGNSGFTTARTQHKILEEAKAVGALIGASSLSAGKKAYKDAKKLDTSVARATGGKPAKPRAAGQGAITSFFSKPAGTVAQVQKPRSPQLSKQTLARSLSLPESPERSYSALSDVSNLQSQAAPTYAAPKPSMFRRPGNAPMLSRPKRLEEEIDNQDPRHVLLSSSPVKPDETTTFLDELPYEEYEADEATSPCKADAHTTTATTSPGFRSASSFHSTTVSQVQSRPGQSSQVKKTLGMRRSVAGWSVKHQGPARPQS